MFPKVVKYSLLRQQPFPINGYSPSIFYVPRFVIHTGKMPDKCIDEHVYTYSLIDKLYNRHWHTKK